MSKSVDAVKQKSYSFKNNMKLQRLKVNELSFQLMKLQKQSKPKETRRKEMIKINIEIKKIKNKGTIVKIHKTQSCLFEKINQEDF